MDIINLTCPRCSGEYYGDTSLLSLDVELHCPFCGSYFKREEIKDMAHADQKTSAIIRMSRDKSFYRPKEKKNREEE
jgi:uncharacterized Zn finger protein